MLMIDSQANKRQGVGASNFGVRLLAPQSELVSQALKDPYVFDFLTLEEPFRERDLETVALTVEGLSSSDSLSRCRVHKYEGRQQLSLYRALWDSQLLRDLVKIALQWKVPRRPMHLVPVLRPVRQTLIQPDSNVSTRVAANG